MTYREYPAPALRLIGYDPVRDLPMDHLARLVEQVVEETIGAPVSSWGDGRPAFDPRLPLKVLLYGYATGARSSRQLEKLCDESLPYLFLTRGDTPSYRTLCTTRTRDKELFETVWIGLFAVGEELGLSRIGRIVIDSTKIRADASPESVVKRKEYEAVLAELERILAEASVVDKLEDSEGFSGSTRLDKTMKPDQMRDILRRVRLKRSQAKSAALEAQAKAQAEEEGEPPRQEDMSEGEGGVSGGVGEGKRKQEKEAAGSAPQSAPQSTPQSTPPITRQMRKRIEEGVTALRGAMEGDLKHISLTDPDARMMGEGRDKKIRECHSFEVATDGGFLVAGQVTQDGNDNARLEAVIEAAGKQEPNGITAVDADSGYYRGDSIAKLIESGIDTCIPDSNTAGDLHRGVPVGTTANRASVLMVYNPERDSYSCPEGNELSLRQERQERGQWVRVYRAVRSCQDCPLASQCLTQAKGKHRTLKVGIHHEVLTAARERFDEQEHRERYRHRAEKVETVFGFLRGTLGYQRWMLRGKERVGSESVLLKNAYQFRKVHTAWSAAQVSYR